MIYVDFWYRGISYNYAIPIQLNIISTSCLIIFIGCHRSLKLPLDDILKGGGDTSKQSDREKITAADAYKFPVVGSAALFGLYIAFKYFGKDVVNLLLTIYFSVAGVVTLTNTISPFLSHFVRGSKQYGFKFNLPLLGEIDARLTVAEMISAIPSIVFAVFYYRTKHFMMNNVLGISFCIQAIEKISLGSYKVGAILLTGLFFYDIFWVFGTDVMVTVAKSLDGPIKLLFPRVSFEEGSCVKILRKAVTRALYPLAESTALSPT